MKKKVIKRKYRELPKYALGTMKPIDLGYQPGRGIGSAQMTTEPGVSLDPETQAIRQNALPKALNYAQMQVPFLTSMFKSTANNTTSTAANTLKNSIKWTNPSWNETLELSKNPTFASTTATTGTAATTAATTATNTATNAANLAANAGTPGLGLIGTEALLNATGTGLSGGLAGTIRTVGKTISKGVFDAVKKATGNAASKGASSALGGASTALGAIGSAYGLYTMGSQIADFGSHRTAQDMQTNMGRQFYTTDKGNTYDAYTGPNLGQELAYENAQTKSKQLGFGVNSIGTGATLGGTIGSIIPGAGTLIGSGIGALAGLVLGGLGSLFGWGDNEEEVKKEARMLADNVSAYNRQQRAVAESKDTSAEFNDRSISSAADGKESYGPMQTKNGDDINTTRFIFDVNAKNKVGVGVPMSKLMPKETVLDKSTGNWGRVPGKGNKDNIYSNVAPGDAHVVFTNKGGISDLAAGVLKSNAPEKLKKWQLNELENMQADLRESEQEQKNMKKYKNGKLPRFANGLDYMFPAAANLFSLIGLNSERNRVKNATFPMYPGVPENPGATRAIDILGNRRFNADPILKQLHNTYRQSLYDINRTPGLGAGGQAVARANAAVQKNRQAAEILGKADEINNQYIADYANAIRDYGNRMQDLMVANNAQRMSLWQQQNAAKENWLAENTRSMSNVIGGLAKDLLGANQFHHAQDYQNKMLKLYGDHLRIEDQKVANEWLQNQELMRFRREQADRDAALARETAEKKNALFNMNYPWQYSWKNYRNMPTFNYTSMLDPIWGIK